MNMWGPLFKKYCKFQHGHSVKFNSTKTEVWALLSLGLCTTSQVTCLRSPGRSHTFFPLRSFFPYKWEHENKNRPAWISTKFRPSHAFGSLCYLELWGPLQVIMAKRKHNEQLFQWTSWLRQSCGKNSLSVMGIPGQSPKDGTWRRRNRLKMSYAGIFKQ